MNPMERNEECSIFFEGRKIISDFQNAILNVFLFGLLNLICRLIPDLEIVLKTEPCSLDIANCVILKDQYGNKKIVKIQVIKVKKTRDLQRYTKNSCVRILNSSYGRFIYDYSLDKFILPKFKNDQKSFEELYENAISASGIIEIAKYYDKTIIYGLNKIEMNILSTYDILLKNIIEPFFIWELFSFITWIAIRYYKYAVVVGSIYFTMLIVNIKNDLRTNNVLKQNLMISNVRVLRDGTFKSIPEYEILPGDLLYIDNTDNFTCDVEILKGSVITDESFLTGESVPICKGPGSIVYSGTKVIKSVYTTVSLNNPNMKNLVKTKCITRKNTGITTEYEICEENELIEDSAIGIAIKTGKRTRRSSLLANLSNKKPVSNEFTKQSAIVVKYLIFGAILLMAVFIGYFIQILPLSTNLEYSIDVALTFFSPALYTCLQLGIQHASRELRKKEISTTEVSRINTAGEVDLVIFDKTGTLTELGVDILCFDNIENTFEKIDDIDLNVRMALSTCHYVVELDDQYSGDVLDMKMFLFSQSKIINKDGKRFIEMEVQRNYRPICKEYTEKEGDFTLFFSSDSNNPSNAEICPEDTLEVLKIHDFDMYLKRLSVVVKDYSGKTYMFCKGAPDSVKKILKSVPESYSEKVRDYGLEGYRVLTVAMKEISEYGNRENDETNLEFLGFLVLANKLKDETCDVIKDLREANLNPKMCTGDGILTAICVAKECGMIDPAMPVLFPVLEDGCKSCYDVEWFSVADEEYIFDKVKMQLYYEGNRSIATDFVVAVEGKEFDYFKSSNYHLFILEKGVVFARFNPDNKKDLIEEYSKAGYVTMFCGDGANDTGALCSADVGLSLATNEASLAASFNSRSLGSVLDVIKEGRSALSMSAAQFKYIFFSQILAGFQMLSLLPQLFFPSDGMSLINDLMSCYVLAYALSNFKAAKKIHKRKLCIDLRVDSFFIFLELLCLLFIFSITSWTISSSKIKSFRAIILMSKNSGAIFVCTMILLVYRSLKFANFGPHRQNLRENKLFISVFLLCCMVPAVIIYFIFSDKLFALRFFLIKKLTFMDKIKSCICFICCLIVTVLFDLYEKKWNTHHKQN